jgi:prepilin-type N-terminal cleavage/methylation domain-containing protein
MRKLGFTLIELLVVIVIMGAVMALVGPFGKEQVERGERINEVRSLELILKTQAKRAFLTGTPYKLSLSGKSLSVINLHDNTSQNVEFEHLFFPESTLFIQMNGVYSTSSLEFVVSGQSKLVTLSGSDEIH